MIRSLFGPIFRNKKSFVIRQTISIHSMRKLSFVLYFLNEKMSWSTFGRFYANDLIKLTFPKFDTSS